MRDEYIDGKDEILVARNQQQKDDADPTNRINLMYYAFDNHTGKLDLDRIGGVIFDGDLDARLTGVPSSIDNEDATTERIVDVAKERFLGKVCSKQFY